MGTTEHGSAAFSDYQGWARGKCFGGRNILYGYPLDKEYKANKARLLLAGPNRHFLSIAPTRSGKGVSLIIPNLLTYAGSSVVIDPKGENAWITAQYRREGLKQKVIILDPWDEVNRRYGDLAGQKETVARFNPLSILDPAGQHYADDLAYLSDAIIINQGKDPHWDDSARELVSGLIAYAVETYRRKASLPMVRMMLSKPSEEVAGIAKEAQKLGFESIAARKLGRFVNDSREISSIISTALTQTAFLDSAALSKNLEASDFSFSDLVNGQATIYLVLPVDKLQTYGRWLRLMVSIGIRTVARNTRPLNDPVLFMLDEFGTIGRLSAVSQAYGLMAGLQMCVWAFVQDLVQLKRDYPDDWETFISNSEVVTLFNLMDQTSCEYFSKAFGSETVEVISEDTHKKRKEWFGNPNYTSMNDKSFGRALIMPEEIRRAQNRIGFTVNRGQPERFEKLSYHDDSDFMSRARLDPHFYKIKNEPKKPDVPAVKELPKEQQAAIPDTKTLITLLKKRGFTTEPKGWLLWKSFVVWSRTAQKFEFEKEADFKKWAYEQTQSKKPLV